MTTSTNPVLWFGVASAHGYVPSGVGRDIVKQLLDGARRAAALLREACEDIDVRHEPIHRYEPDAWVRAGVSHALIDRLRQLGRLAEPVRHKHSPPRPQPRSVHSLRLVVSAANSCGGAA